MRAKTFKWPCLALALAALVSPGCAPEDDELDEDKSHLTTISPALSPRWSRSIANAYGVMLAVDGAGNVLVTGSIPYTNIVTAKFDAAGTLLWQQVYAAPSVRVQASWIAVDAAGNAYVSGYAVTGSSNDPTGFVVLKYDPLGALVWEDVMPLTWGRTARIEVDAAGNAYVTGQGWVGGAMTYTDFVTLKYAPDGTRLWLRTHDFQLTTDIAASMAVAADGTVAVTGSHAAYSTMITVVYDTNGNVRWSRGANLGPANDVAFGPNGEVFVTGGSGNFVVQKHDASGNVVWTASNPGFAGHRLAVDGAGNVAATGIAYQTYGMPYVDWLTMKLDAAGAVVWTQRYDAHENNDEMPRAIALASDGAVVVTGNGGPVPLSSTIISNFQMVTVEYGPTGAPSWITTTTDSELGVAARVVDGSAFTLGHSSLVAARVDRPSAAPPPTTDPVVPPPTDPVLPPPEEPPPPPPPEPPPPEPVVVPMMKVTDILLDGQVASKLRANVAGRVQVRDQNGAVAGAVVTVTWAMPKGLTSTVTRLTDSTGAASFTVSGATGQYTLTVGSVTKTGSSYDEANSVKSKTIRVK